MWITTYKGTKNSIYNHKYVEFTIGDVQAEIKHDENIKDFHNRRSSCTVPLEKYIFDTKYKLVMYLYKIENIPPAKDAIKVVHVAFAARIHLRPVIPVRN